MSLLPRRPCAARMSPSWRTIFAGSSSCSLVKMAESSSNHPSFFSSTTRGWIVTSTLRIHNFGTLALSTDFTHNFRFGVLSFFFGCLRFRLVGFHLRTMCSCLIGSLICGIFSMLCSRSTILGYHLLLRLMFGIFSGLLCSRDGSSQEFCFWFGSLRRCSLDSKSSFG